MNELTFLLALQFAARRGVTLPAEYYTLDMAGRQYAQTVSYLASLDQIQQVMDSYHKVAASGGTLQDFKDLVRADGIKLPVHHLDNVFRTNIQNAYAHGRYLHQHENKANRPYLQYSAIQDTRTRPSHLALNGVIRHIDDPFWQTHYPPCGFRCRCSVVAITEATAKRKGITADDDLPDVQPDKGWDFSPADYVNHPDYLIKVRQAREAGADIRAAVQLSQFSQGLTFELTARQQIVDALPIDTQQLAVMVDKAIALDASLAPSQLAIIAGLAKTADSSFSALIKTAAVQQDQADSANKRVWQLVQAAFDAVWHATKNVTNELKGTSIRGLNDVPLNKGDIINFQTPTLLGKGKGKTITILDAKGIAIDLQQISDLDGYLLAPNMNFKVLDVTDSEIVLQRTDAQAARYFVAEQQLYKLY